MTPALPSRTERPSLEALVEAGMLQLDSLHPGGLELTRELASRCDVGRGDRLLDVACGTGESACFLAETFEARVCGVDHSDEMLRRGEEKARARGLDLDLRRADATALPFADGEFDVAVCECTLCLLDKERALGEMARVVRPGGRVGMHDLFWKTGAPASLARALAELEDERPETLDGWRRLFERAGLDRVEVVDRSASMAEWMRGTRRRIGAVGQLALALAVVRRWGLGGLWRVLRSERVFASAHLGYAIVVGTKP